jgi:hypothetical protein
VGGTTHKTTHTYDALGRPVTILRLFRRHHAAHRRRGPHGAITSIQVGTNPVLIEQHCYSDSRMQVTGIRVGLATSANCTNAGDPLNLAFSCATQNNGNLASQTIQYQSGTEPFQSLTQNCTGYDGMNRLTGLTPTLATHYNTATNRLAMAQVAYDTGGRGNVAAMIPCALAYDGEGRLMGLPGVPLRFAISR